MKLTPLLIAVCFALGFYDLVYHGTEPFGLLAGVVLIATSVASYLQPADQGALSQRDSKIFTETLMTPPEPNKALRKAAKAYNRIQENVSRRAINNVP